MRSKSKRPIQRRSRLRLSHDQLVALQLSLPEMAMGSEGAVGRISKSIGQKRAGTLGPGLAIRGRSPKPEKPVAKWIPSYGPSELREKSKDLTRAEIHRRQAGALVIPRVYQRKKWRST